MSSISLKNVVKAYGDLEVIHSVSLDIKDGEFVVFVGPSGCGKSTLLRMIAGLEDITAGTISIGDAVVNDIPPRGRDVAMVFQDYALYPHMTVAQNIGFGLKMRGVPPDRIASEVEAAAAILQISHLLSRHPRNLSGGQRQRVAMGRAIVRDPEVFLFDEPLSNLDAKLRAEMRTEIKRLHQRLGKTVVYVTHDQVEAMTLADRIVILNGGHIEQRETPDTIYNMPASRFVATFTGSPPMNLMQARISLSGTHVITGSGPDVPLPPHYREGAAAYAGHAVELGLRPEHFSQLNDGAPQVEAELGLVVSVIEPLGSDTLVFLTGSGADIVARLPPNAKLRQGERMRLAFDPAQLHLFCPDTGRSIALPPVR